MKITKVLTDNGSQFTDRFTTRTMVPTGQHLFDCECTTFGIEQVIKKTRFKSGDELEVTLGHCADTDNHRIPQRALNHLSPVQALKKWQRERPELFVKRVYDLTGLDSYPSSS